MKKDRWPVWLKRVTEFMFLLTTLCAVLWVTNTCALAWYATVKLGQPFPLEALSSDIITVILGALALKVIGNIFEHNDSAIFGTSRKDDENV